MRSSDCSADYLNHYDGVNLANDANNTNMLLQTVDPLNPDRQNTHSERDGQRAVAAVNGYRGVASHGSDLDCAGDKGTTLLLLGRQGPWGPIQTSKTATTIG